MLHWGIIIRYNPTGRMEGRVHIHDTYFSDRADAEAKAHVLAEPWRTTQVVPVEVMETADGYTVLATIDRALYEVLDNG